MKAKIVPISSSIIKVRYENRRLEPSANQLEAQHENRQCCVAFLDAVVGLCVVKLVCVGSTYATQDGES